MTDSKSSRIEGFDGILLHPSLDVKDGIMVLGFRYKAKPSEDKDLFIIISDKDIWTTTDESFTYE